MSKVDYRNSSTSKRARTDGGRREDDWTCPSCGNVNFSFRTTCNMRNCHQSRPVDHNLKLVGNPMQHSHSHSHGFLPPVPYVGSGGPSSMYMGLPPYGSSVYNGSSMPRYDVPLARGSHLPYEYGRHISGGSPYRSLPLSSPPPYSGGMYGMPPPMIDRYGLIMPMGHTAMGPRIEYFSEEKPHKKDATRDNDWKCPNCRNVNFSFRTVCNMRKCNTPKPGPQVAKSDKNPKQRLPEGSWKCENCNNVNFPFRNKCNRQNCGAEKPSEEDIKSPSETTNGNDQ
ncbi:ranBP2-type zinc finger protein At1g67325-like [Impatiens glandulifera]|uniref:ranBP2-type zinc finger protein At1g67325-like n=1 Tax=Impatiens glandulifera TaxID=253017 RepID=UPI001FB0AAEB|nr:ranBP2-type zinc finger protein At1g67325-like [Impatiens glandulifera]